MQKQTKFIVFIILVIIVIGGIGLYFGLKPEAPSKYDQFAQALTEKGAVFYGAFWCPHCQVQKAEFGTAKQYLPYVECSNPDQSQTQICIDKKIESYPTWTFKTDVTLTSDADPLICPIKTTEGKESEACVGRSSEYFKTWFFTNYSFSAKGLTDPIKEGNTFKFPAGTEFSGEIPMEFLAKQIGFTLPQ
jgi:hypothetical protein